jgi:peroxiredoxin
MKIFNIMMLHFILILANCCKEGSKSCEVLIEDFQNLMKGQLKLNNEMGNIKPEIKNGYFVFSPVLNKPEYFVLTIGNKNYTLYLAPGYNISIPSGTTNPGNISRFSGKGALLNNYIQNDFYMSQCIQNKTNFDSIYSLAPSDFIYCIDSLYNIKTLNLENFILKNGIKEEVFISTERKRIYYSSAIEKNQYYRDHIFLTNEVPILNERYDSYLEKADFNDPDLLHLPDYKKFLSTYFERVGLQDYNSLQNKGKRIHFTEYSYAWAKRMAYEKKVKNYVLYKIMDSYVNSTPIDYSRNLVLDFFKECTDENYKYLIDKSSKALDKLKKGMPAPEFTFTDVNGIKVGLSDFRGRIVYIDVWNSNCSPCFKEFPVMEKLINKYSNKEIAFIGISFDSDKTLWEKTMRANNLKGIQLFANGWDSQFGRDYMVWSNPRFILIDKNGNFISARAPKPSEIVDTLIEQNL